MADFFPAFMIIRWQDVLDIILNSYILFRLYVLFRGTNVFRVLMGLALLWFFQKIAAALGLIVSSVAIQGITAAAALIIIVVFRNEIRSVLQAKNFRAIFWGFPRQGTDSAVEIISDSAFELAQRRIGALLVFPGKEDLRETVHSGLAWNGSLSREMLVTIFWPDNPVHDGAAVIQGNRISEVGVILPLSRRKDLPSSYGTRHRAAAGLSEATDALVILVSEEKGRVVSAKGSDIHTVKGRRELAEILRDHFGTSSKRSGFLRREMLELGMAALFSLLFVTGVWFSFTKGLESLLELEVPVEYMNRDPGMTIVDTSVNKVKLGLIGAGPLIRTIRPEQITVRLDLSKGTIGKNNLAISPENVTLPPGISLKQIKPDSVQVTLDKPFVMEIPVQVDWVGKLSDQLIISDVTLSPDKIQVVGGKEALSSLSTIYTEKVPLDEIKKSGTLNTTIKLDRPSLGLAPSSKNKVTVTYEVKERSPSPEQE